MPSQPWAGPELPFPKELSAASRLRAADHTFLAQLTSALAAQNPPVTLVIDDMHVLTRPTVLTEVDFIRGTRSRACGWWLSGWIRSCPCTVTGWLVS